MAPKDHVLHSPFAGDRWWTRSNVGEAIPGVPTPLGWTIWMHAGERCTREPFFRMGAATRRERRVPEAPADRVVQIFHGRPSVALDHMTAMGDRLPGTSGRAIAQSILGTVPRDLQSASTRRRYPIIAVRMPTSLMSLPREVRAAERSTAQWWETEIARIPTLGREETVRCFIAAAKRFEHNVVLTSTVLVTVLQPIYDLLDKISTASGVGDATELAASLGGTPEAAMVSTLWDASRGHLDVAAVQRRFGYHGPHEGELSGRVWREDPAPLVAMIRGYGDRPDADAPSVLSDTRHDRRRTLEREILAATPRTRRAATRLALQVAARLLPLRGTGKKAFLQSLDVARAAARHAGHLLADRGILTDPDDIFYLTVEEFVRSEPGHLGEVVPERRDYRAECQRLELPSHWRGTPQPSAVSQDRHPQDQPITGIGVSPGVVEGIVRVVADPAFADVEPGEILVAPSTDPSWASVMFLSAALVVDIGGALSHAAIVARELGVPCVVNTGNGTRALRDGDRVRVDGTAGTVQVLDRVDDTPH